MVPPTPELVSAFLEAAQLAPDVVIGEVPTREVTVTAEHVAINAVMAGCRADYMPVVVAAVRAHLSEKGNCHSTTGTLSGAAQVVIVNGPARQALDINCTAGCFGPGWRANATIGRALRLVIRNVCRAIPNFLDRATFSTPARYTFCFGEDEEGSDWLPMSVERGIPAGTSAVTVASMMTTGPATDFVSRTPEGVTASIAKAIRAARDGRRRLARRGHQCRRRHGPGASPLLHRSRMVEGRRTGRDVAAAHGAPAAG